MSTRFAVIGLSAALLSPIPFAQQPVVRTAHPIARPRAAPRKRKGSSRRYRE